MNWLIWKQHRKQFMMLAIIIALYIAVAIPTGLHFWNVYQHARTGCNAAHACDQLSGTLLQNGWEMNLNPSLPSGGLNLVILFLMATPFLLGMFVGVPLISREYNSNTNLLIWTRSISRRKWLTMKLLWILGVTLVFAGLFAALTTWWSRTGNALYVDRFANLKFGLQGIAPVGYALFAVSIGIMLGAWLKRTMVAVGLTLLLVLAAQVGIASFVRPHYMSPKTQSVWTDQLNPTLDSAQAPRGALVVDAKLVNRQGQSLDWLKPPQQCIVAQDNSVQSISTVSHQKVGVDGGDGTLRSVNGGPTVSGSCLRHAGYHYEVKYQPADRYWNFQIIEFSLYLLLSFAAVGVTYVLVLKRDA